MRRCAGCAATPFHEAGNWMTNTSVADLDERLLIQRWLEVKEHNEGRSTDTITTYEYHLIALRKYLLTRKMTLLTATPEAIEDFAGKYQHERKVRPISRRVTVTAIRGFYQWATRKGVLDENPAACLASPTVGRALPRAMSMTHAEKLLMEPGIKTFPALRDTAILAVLIGTGCRVSGVRNLTEQDLIWTQTKTGTERLIMRLTEKGKKERLVPVPLECSLLIRAYLGHPDLGQIDRTLPTGKRVLFVNLHNPLVPAHRHFGEMRCLSRRYLHMIVRKYGQRAGIPAEYCHPHALRHLYGTELAEHDVDLLMRQSLLGHASPATTEVYTRLAMRKLTKTVDLANPLGKMPSSPSYALAERLRKQAN